jgi:hypothetical protein
MSIYSQFFVPKGKFDVKDIPDLAGQIIIVTGGYGGIGYETTKGDVYIFGPVRSSCAHFKPGYFPKVPRYKSLKEAKKERRKRR